MVATPDVQAVFTRLKQDFPDKHTYLAYWDSIAPRDEDEYFRRWLFAFCSVHTTWESNVKGYEAIRDFHSWEDDKQLLLHRLIRSGAGLYNNRANWIWEFHADFWQDPGKYYRGNETWSEMRNRLAKQVKGLGLAKTSFAIEMCAPLKAEVTCLDVHMLRLYGCAELNGKKNEAQYQSIEADWLDRSQDLGVPPYISRCAYWDMKQGARDSRYWSHALETRH